MSNDQRARGCLIPLTPTLYAWHTWMRTWTSSVTCPPPPSPTFPFTSSLYPPPGTKGDSMHLHWNNGSWVFQSDGVAANSHGVHEATGYTNQAGRPQSVAPHANSTGRDTGVVAFVPRYVWEKGGCLIM